MLTELLAPAKDKETAFAAIDCGADAVYIGACAFGARKKASNSIEDLKEVVIADGFRVSFGGAECSRIRCWRSLHKL